MQGESVGAVACGLMCTSAAGSYKKASSVFFFFQPGIRDGLLQ